MTNIKYILGQTFIYKIPVGFCVHCQSFQINSFKMGNILLILYVYLSGLSFIFTFIIKFPQITNCTVESIGKHQKLITDTRMHSNTGEFCWRLFSLWNPLELFSLLKGYLISMFHEIHDIMFQKTHSCMKAYFDKQISKHFNKSTNIK